MTQLCEIRQILFALVAICLSAIGFESLAQETVSTVGSVPTSTSTPRMLADGVLRVIPPEVLPEDTALGPFDMEFVASHPDLAWLAPDFPDNQPHFNSATETILERGKAVTFRHPVYCLEFAYKPLRTISVNLPGADGKPKSSVIWYLLYRVRYVGEDLVPSVEIALNGMEMPSTPEMKFHESVLFIPHFQAHSHKYDERTRQRSERTYSERILPHAIAAIARRERVGRPIYDSIEITRRISMGSPGSDDEVWGVATWNNIDPSADFLSISVEGLTNAYRIEEGTEGKTFKKRVLELYFWRPGDPFHVTQNTIYVGSPAWQDKEHVDYFLKQFGLEKRVDYLWNYR